MLWAHAESKYDLRPHTQSHITYPVSGLFGQPADFTSVQEIYKNIHESSPMQSMSCKQFLSVLSPMLLLQFGLSAFNAKVIRKSIVFFADRVSLPPELVWVTVFCAPDCAPVLLGSVDHYLFSPFCFYLTSINLYLLMEPPI